MFSFDLLLIHSYKIDAILYLSLQVCDLLPYYVGFGLEAGHVSMIFDKALVSKGEPLASIRDLSVSLRRGEFNLHAFYADKNGQPLDASQKITSFFVCLRVQDLFNLLKLLKLAYIS